MWDYTQGCGEFFCLAAVLTDVIERAFLLLNKLKSRHVQKAIEWQINLNRFYLQNKYIKIFYQQTNKS